MAADRTRGFRLGLCIYSDPGADSDPERYALMPSIQAPTQWSWSGFSWIGRSEDVLAIIDALEQIFSSDPEIQAVTRHDDVPL
ncbi:hypothetical protein H6G65_15305 [Microcystis elabens FACHB-917]|nr:hypothetical protein [Microcystis elabens FACHB-917]